MLFAVVVVVAAITEAEEDEEAQTKDEYALKVKTCERETLTLHHKSYHFSFFVCYFFFVFTSPCVNVEAYI